MDFTIGDWLGICLLVAAGAPAVVLAVREHLHLSHLERMMRSDLVAMKRSMRWYRRQREGGR